jgi:hypothetical protein
MAMASTMQDVGENVRDTVRDAMTNGYGTLRGTLGRLPSGEDLLDAIGLQYRRTSTEALIATLGAFALGCAVGAAVALLMAPRSGAETRRELGRQARELGQQASEAAQRVGDRVRSMDDRTTMS